MADYTAIKNLITDVVKANGEQEITGTNLQNVLVSIINAVDSSNNGDFARINDTIISLLNHSDAEDADIRNDMQELAGRLDTNRYGYNVTVFGLVAGVHTLATAVKNVPPAERFGGQKITFKTDSGWVTYQNTSLSTDNYEDVDNWVLDSGVNVEGDVTITNNPDYEDLTQNNQNELKFADKEYNADTFSGLGRTYLRKNIVNGQNVLTSAMLADENTIYIVQYDYDLDGEEVTVPSGCVLKFQGGSFNNGKIICQNTLLDGDVKIDLISGTIIGTFKSSYSKHTCNFAKLKSILTIAVDKLVIDEDFEIADVEEEIISSIPYIEGINAVINVYHTTHKYRFIQLSNCNSVSGISIDMNSNPIFIALYINTASATSKIDNISIKNIHTASADNMVNGVYGIYAVNNSELLNIENIYIDNFIVYGDGQPTTGTGSVVGIFVGNSNVTSLFISNIYLKNILNVNGNGKYILDDASGIYVANSNILTNESNVFIQNINATNGGKRVIKSDCKNISIKTLYSLNNISHSKFASTSTIWLAVIGLNTGDNSEVHVNANIQDINIFGDFLYGIAVTRCTLNLNGMVAEMTNNLYSSLISANNSNVSAVNINGKNTSILKDSNNEIQIANFVLKNDGVVSNMSIFNGSDNIIKITGFSLDLNTRILYRYESGNSNNVLIADNFKFIYDGINVPLITLSEDASITNKTNSLYLSNGSYEGNARGIIWGNLKSFHLDNVNIVNKRTNLNIARIFTDDDSDITLHNLNYKENGGTLYSALDLRHSGNNPFYIDIDNSIPKIACSTEVNTAGIYWMSKNAFPLIVSGEGNLSTLYSVGLQKSISNLGIFELFKFDNKYTPVSAICLTKSNLTVISSTISLSVGVNAYATDLNKPVWWNGAAWVDATGATV